VTSVRFQVRRRQGKTHGHPVIRNLGLNAKEKGSSGRVRRRPAHWKRETGYMADTDVLMTDGNAYYILHSGGKIIRVAKYRITRLIARAILDITENE
jgi:hypothetical protein